MRLLLALMVLFGAGSARAADFDALYASLERGDTPAMTEIVETLFSDAGISVNDSLVWELQPYDYTFNYYDQYSEKIVLGSIPAAADVDAYWDNWSQVLTGGKWQRQSFFTSAADAAMLGAYNGFVIAVHELGHGVTYRYDAEHQKRHDYSVNCRELYADRYAASMSQQAAQADPRFAALRARYIEIMASMNAAIAEQDRYHIESLAALDADCDIIHVEQPTPETLQPYASAYFERLRLLFGADMPPPADLAETWLEPHRAAFMADMPYGAEAKTLALTTLQPVPGFVAVNNYVQDAGAYAAGFDLSGQLYLAEMLHADDTDIISFNYGPPGALAPVVTNQPYLRKIADLELVSIAPLSADRFFAVVNEYMETRAVLLVGERRDGAWMLEAISELDGMPLARVMQTSAGQLYVLASTSAGSIGSNDGWVSVGFDPRTFEGHEGPAFARVYGVPLALQANGDLLTYGFDLIYDFDTEGGFDVLAGNSLPGSKDAADPGAMEFMEIAALQQLPDGRILILDAAPDRSSGLIRQLRPQ